MAFTAILMTWYGIAPDARLLALPLFVLLAALLSLGLGLLMAALTVAHRSRTADRSGGRR